VVDSAIPSRINGALTADGHVVLINPYGITIGGQIEAGSLLASTINLTYLNVTDLIQQYDNFRSGRAPLRFQGSGGDLDFNGRLAATDTRSLRAI